MSIRAQPAPALSRRRTQRVVRGEKPRRTLMQTILLYLLTGTLGLMFTGPFLWTLTTSLKTPYEILQYPPSLLPVRPQFANYLETWRTIDFGTFTKNSLYVTILSVIGSISSSALVAYGFARYRFPGRNFLFILCLSGMMLPPQVTIIPLFMVFRAVRWIDTFKPLIVPSFLGGGAFNIFLLRQFFMTLPLELDEAATIDGASKLTIFLRIMLPLSGPALASAAIFSFGANWNSFLQPLIFLNSKSKFTLPLGLTYLVQQPYDPGLPKDHLMMAAAVLTTLPMLILFFSGQKYFVRGIVTTGIKG
jgi:multiple sugar transport system permease protein